MGEKRLVEITARPQRPSALHGLRGQGHENGSEVMPEVTFRKSSDRRRKKFSDWFRKGFLSFFTCLWEYSDSFLFCNFATFSGELTRWQFSLAALSICNCNNAFQNADAFRIHYGPRIEAGRQISMLKSVYNETTLDNFLSMQVANHTTTHICHKLIK